MTFQILALSGGGFRGLFTAQVLTELERQAGRPLAQCFDLIAGTSIGGIIALGLALERPAAEIRDLFSRRGASIFSSRPKPKNWFFSRYDYLRFLCKPKYTGEDLREAVEDVLGHNTLLGDAQHRVLVPTVNMTRGKVQMLKTPHHQNFVSDHRLRMVDVAMATSAAPTYFPLADLEDSRCVDGGIVANAPDLCALHEATHFLNQSRDDIRILSIGTTTSHYSLSHAVGRNLGSYQWMVGGRLMSTMISAQQQLTEYMLGHLLEGRYVRIDEPQSHEQEGDLGLDIATVDAQRTMRGLAAGAYQRASALPMLTAILAHVAVPPVFYAGSNANSV